MSPKSGGNSAFAGERPLVVVSNREPYQHTYDASREVQCSPTTGGVSVALDDNMRERGGVWIAHGSGNDEYEFSEYFSLLRSVDDGAACATAHCKGCAKEALQIIWGEQMVITEE